MKVVSGSELPALKALLALEIVRMLDEQSLTLCAAQQRTGVAAADFSRIRTNNLGRFSLDRLVMILNALGCRVDVKVFNSKGESD